MLLLNVLIIYAVSSCFAQLNPYKRLRRFQMHPALQWKQRLMQNRNRRPDKVCYDNVGCFEVPHKRSPLTKIPESPDVIDTKFFLFKRDIKSSHPEILHYQDKGLSLNQSKFDPKETVKIIIHGYMGRWNERGALESVDAYLKIYNCNVILVDWEKGARGPQYANAAANTEVVGRQLGILLLHMINYGLKPQNIHLLGFSLGAHVAGCASELLKIRGHLIGRITGLDAASPLFRHNNFREKSRKLDKEDAVFVDAIHTDASPFFTDGFGLLEPIGHVDFFPNGGFEQPGCVDSTASVVMSHFEGALTREIACSHIRAWQLFLETLKRKAIQAQDCEFIAYKCRGGLGSFQKGHCFPQISPKSGELALDSSYRTDLGRLGEDVLGEGVMYLVTRGSRPYCGTQLQTSVTLSQKTQTANGVIHMHLEYENGTTDFQVPCEAFEFAITAKEMNGLASTAYNSVNPELQLMSANLIYIHTESEGQNRTKPGDLYLDRVTVRDMYGHSWQYCGRDTLLQHLGPITVKLNKEEC